MITKNDLLEWLKTLDIKLKRKITLVAVGGTAMTLLGLKSSTIDVDFCIESKDKKFFEIKNAKFKIDFFLDGYIFSEQLPEDYIEKSSKVEANLENIDLRTLSPMDIIITKTARYNERDEEDITSLVKSTKIKKKELEERFRQVRETFAGNIKDYDYNFKIVLKRHFE